jgi:hypothetical protein
MGLFGNIGEAVKKSNETDQLPKLPVVIDNNTIINVSMAVVIVAGILVLMYNLTKRS